MPCQAKYTHCALGEMYSSKHQPKETSYIQQSNPPSPQSDYSTLSLNETQVYNYGVHWDIMQERGAEPQKILPFSVELCRLYGS